MSQNNSDRYKMMFKPIIICALAYLVQQCMAGSCYRPTKPSCGCGSGVVIKEIEEIEEISYRPVSVKSGYSSGYSGYSGGYSGCVSIDVPTSGGAFAVTSIGGIAPSGIAVATDLGLAGDLVLSGELPYLTAVAFEGQFSSCGEVPVAYSCGDGCIAITEQIGGINAGAGGYDISSIKSCGCKY